MKKVVSVLLIISVFLFVACAQQPAPVVEEEEPTPEPEPEVEEEPEPEVEEEPEEEGFIEAEVQELFDKAKSRTKSLSYSYQGPENEGDLDTYYIKDNLVRIELGDKYRSPDTDDDAYNAVYLDTGVKTAEAFCDEQVCIKRGKKRSLSYNDHITKSPLEWLDEITSASKVGEARIEDRNAWKLDTNVGEVYVDSFYGLPQRIVSPEGVEYEFIRITVNDVKDEELRP